MKIEFKSKNPEIQIEEDVCLDGKSIGWVRTSSEDGKSRCHAALTTSNCGLIQGFGHTREAAILAAIVDGRRETQRKLSGIDELEKRLCA